MAEQVIDRELSWDDEIDGSETGYTLIQPGDYNYTVISVERARHEGSDKIPLCNKAIVSIKIHSPEGDITIKHNFMLYSFKYLKAKLSEFFVSIGQIKPDQVAHMNWAAVPGSTGKCKVYIDKWTNNKGEEKESNKIEKFYAPDDSSTPTQQQYQNQFMPQSTSTQYTNYPQQQPAQYSQPQTTPPAQAGGVWTPGSF